MTKPPTVNRKEFIRKWMQECGLTYDAASQVYQTMVSTFEEGVASGQKVTIGRLGALVPKWQDAREVTMGFRRVPSGIVRQRHVFIQEGRYRYKFKIYKEWMASRRLDWSR